MPLTILATIMWFLVVLILALSPLSLGSENAPKVNFELYYESLCPDCREFILQQLFPAYQKVSGIINLTLVPYGNADESKHGGEWKYTCQHGKEECIGNMIETCVLHIEKNITASLQFVHCFEKNIVQGEKVENPLSVAEQCAEDLDMDYPPIEECQKSELGNKLEHDMATKTNALSPQHQYVPWVTLNGVHTEKIQDRAQGNLLKLLCETYTGKKPSPCQNVHEGRCYKNAKNKQHFDG